MNILSHDPSIRAWGWSVITPENEVISCGCIDTKPMHKKTNIRKGDDTVRRINEIVSKLVEVINEYGIEYMVTEQPHGSQSASAAVMIGIVTGILGAMSLCLDIPIDWYSEGDCKKNLLNTRAASKGQVIRAIKEHYEVPWTNVGFRDEAIADSLAVYHLARISSPFIQFARKNSHTNEMKRTGKV